MLTLRLTLLGLALFALGLASCSSDPCADDSECGSSQYCQSGSCVDLCVEHEDCANDRICDRGICVEPRRCATGADCQFGFVCEDSLCLPQAVECGADSDCPPEFRCCGGACYQPGVVAPACDSSCADDGDCGAGERCEGRVCVSDDAGVSDVGADAQPDTQRDTGEPDAEEDTTPDSPPDSDPDPDAGCRGQADCEPDENCVEGECVPALDATPDVPDECEGRDDGQLGERCVSADDCCNGLCFGNPDAGRGVCTDTCGSYRDCNPVGGGGDELFCYREPALDAPLCALSDYGDSCRSSADCVDGRCLVASRGNSCTYRCATTADCASGSACGLVAFSDGETEFGEYVCVPIGATPCAGPTDCLSGTCLTDDETFVSYCSTICNTSDPNACPSPYRCTELPDGGGGTLPVCTLP